VIAVAQLLEVHATVCGAAQALDAARRQRGRWLDPHLVDAAQEIAPLLARWGSLDEAGLRREVREVEPGDAALLAGPGTLECIAEGFAEVVDAKSPFTAQHSSRVCGYALGIADMLGFGPAERDELNRAALLHDIGKLSVPNSILDKPGPLTAEEWDVVRLHPYYTQRILEHIRGFERLANVAALHHERLDGRGYFHGLRGDQIPLPSQVIATADIYDALTTERPYRRALSEDEALELMERDRGTGLRPECLDALIEYIERGAPDGAIEAREARAIPDRRVA
jgi:HD-GYP domain-containing protein (c-di-GMP phosphodiesterase class II)